MSSDAGQLIESKSKNSSAKAASLLRLPVGCGGVINSPRSGFFLCQKLGSAHG